MNRRFATALLLTGLLFALTPALRAEAPPAATPESVGLSSERLARLHAGMQQYVDQGRVSGVVTYVARNGRVVDLQAFGKADAEAGRPMYTTSFNYNPATNIAELAEGDLIIYPNPASDLVFIQDVNGQDGKRELEIYSTNGSLVYKQSVSFENQRAVLKINELTAGIYYIKILSGEKPVVNRMIKL